MVDLSRRSLFCCALAGTAATVSACSPSDHRAHRGSRANCFVPGEDGQLDGVRVFQQAAPPLNDRVGIRYPYWPCTDAVTTQDMDRSSWTEGRIWAFVWANRCNSGPAWNRKPNPLPAPVERVGDLECRAVFSTLARANAATRCQIRYLLGMSRADYEAPWLRLPGTSTGDFVADADFRTHPGFHCRRKVTWQNEDYRVMVDKVLLPADRLTDGSNAVDRAGVVLDYEVQDSRRPEITEALVQELAYDFTGTGKSFVFLTNPFNAPTQKYTGCCPANLPSIFAAVDYMVISLWSGDPSGSIPASYAAQLGMLGPMTGHDYDKLIVYFELGDPGTTEKDAHWLHNMLHAARPHPDKVMFWRNHATQGGSCDTSTNQKISIVCFGGDAVI